MPTKNQLKVNQSYINVYLFILLIFNNNKKIDIANILGIELGKLRCGRFADGEV